MNSTHPFGTKWAVFPLQFVVAFGLVVVSALSVRGQAPLITSFGQNGELVCTNLAPGTKAVVEWASSVTGPWTNNWAGLDSVTVDSNGTIRVNVPMFYRVRGVPINMALIPAGSFMMGDALNEGNLGEHPMHSVYVSTFYMDRYEVTKALWDEVYQWAITHGYDFENPGLGKAANHPVHTVSWFDAVKWCNARSEKEGRVPAYYTEAGQTTVYRTGLIDVQNDWVKWNTGYRLPTEAEWEKAARGGASGHRFPWANEDTINHSRANYYSRWSGGHPYYTYDVNSNEGYHSTYNDGVPPYTSPVGSFAPNGYGLYDMAGNVWEWCWDCYSTPYYSSSPESDPRGPSLNYERVMRGGCWDTFAEFCRVADRLLDDRPPHPGPYLGFRAVLPAGQ